jgi:hypothetical protein
VNLGRPLLVVSVCSILFGCLGAPPDLTDVLSPSKINSNPSSYNGADVYVRGYVRVGPGEQGHFLYESKRLDEEFKRKFDSGRSDFEPGDYAKYCLTIANPDIFLLNQKAASGITLVVRGKINSNYLREVVDLGACPLAPAIEVDVADLERRYPSIFKHRGER